MKSIGLVFFGLLYINVLAQTTDIEQQADSIVDQGTITVEAEKTERVHYPRKATIYSAVLPGLGQIYNRQAWKTPFVYGGFVALGLVVEHYHRYNLNFKKSYYHLNDKNPKTTFYNEFPVKREIDEFNPPQNLNREIENNINNSSRQRDRYIIFTAAFYLFNILDANVNAHFIDFDISEDLTFNFNPIAIDPLTSTPIYGATLTYNF
jgi:hypothetical protein